MEKSPKKITYLIDDYRTPYAGTEGQLLTLIRELDKSEFSPEITLFRESDYINKHGFPCTVNVLNITRLLSFHTIKEIILFALSLRKNDCRLVHIFFNDASIIAPAFLKLSGCKVIISRRDMGYWYTPLTTFILRINRFFIDAVITNSEAVKLVTHENERVPISKIHVIYNGYNSNKFTSPDSGVDKTIINTNPKSQVIGLVANIRPIKRIDDLICAFSRVNKDIPDTELVIVGSGDTKQLEDLAHDLNLRDKIHFLGGQSNVTSIIKKFDVAVLCSESEGFSNSIIEYMQCLIPVVCNDVGGNSEIVKNNETGYLVHAGDIEELAEKISMVLRNPAHAKKMAGKAYDFVLELCDKNKMIEKYAAIYNAI